MTRLYGDWRSGAYGANRRAHLFVHGPWGSGKRAACGARTSDRYARANTATGQSVCLNCLVYGASGRLVA